MIISTIHRNMSVHMGVPSDVKQKNKQMKIKMKIKGLLIALLLIIPISCGEDFLNEKPMAFLSPENTFVDAVGLKTPLDAALKAVLNQWNGDTREFMFNQNMSDVSVIGATDKPDAFVDLRRYATPQNSRNNDAGRARTFYEECYKHLKNANTVIDYVDQVEWTDGLNNPERNHLLGSAYFLRAFFYFQQTMQFGNCAFPLNVVTTARQDFKAFTMQSIWDQMIVDLEWAVKHVKPASQLPKGQVPNAGVRMLLAKYYMLNLRFADAEAEMTTVINSGEYALVTDADVNVETVRIGSDRHAYNDTLLPGRSAEVPADAINFLHMNWNNNRLTNSEGIWVFANEWGWEGNAAGRADRVRAFGPNFVSTNQGITSPQGGGGTDIRQGTGTMMMKWGRGQGFARITNYAQYEIWNFKGELDTEDYRHKPGNWFDMDFVLYDHPDLKDTEYWLTPLRLYKDPTLPHAQRVQLDNLLVRDTIRCWYGYPIYKFWAYDFDRPHVQNGGQADLYVYRLAEVYLLRAEARFWQDNFAGAAEDLNVIRERANAMHMYTAGDVQAEGIGAILDERARELYGEEYRHDELVRISAIFAKSGKTAYNGKTYTFQGGDLEVHLSENSFYYDRMMERNNFFREEVPWVTYPTTRYTMDPMHIFWPIYEPYIIGNVQNVLNQTTGYDGSERNVEPLVHIVQPAGVPNIDPMVAIGEREE